MQFVYLILSLIFIFVILSIVATVMSFIMAVILGPVAKVDFDDSMSIAKTAMSWSLALTVIVTIPGLVMAENDTQFKAIYYSPTGAFSFFPIYQFVFVAILFHVVGIINTALTQLKWQRNNEKKQKEMSDRETQAAYEAERKAQAVAESIANEAKEKEELHKYFDVASLDELLGHGSYEISEYGDMYHLISVNNDNRKIIGKFIDLDLLKKHLITELKINR